MLPTVCAHGLPGVKLIASAACVAGACASVPAASAVASRPRRVRDLAFIVVSGSSDWRGVPPAQADGTPDHTPPLRTAGSVLDGGHRAGSGLDRAAVAARIRILVEI